MKEQEEYYTTNNVTGIIKIIAIITCIVGIIVCLISSEYLAFYYTIIGIIVSIISAVFIYAIAELIEIMHDIRTNTEHLRDYFEREKK